MSDTTFTSILETALTKPDSFIQSILPEIKTLTEDKLSVMANVLESGSVIDKQNITKLFVEYLGESGCKYLADNSLDVGRPKLYIQAANIIGELHYVPALPNLQRALHKDCIELVLPSVKAISLLP